MRGKIKRSIQTNLSIVAGDSQDEDLYEQALIAVEKFAFLSAFIIRKLLEAKKLSDELESVKVSVRKFERINFDREITYLNWDHVEQFYDLTDPVSDNISVRTLCNMLIHSFIFLADDTKETPEINIMLFNSDFTKDKALYEIDLATYFELVESVANDNVASMR